MPDIETNVRNEITKQVRLAKAPAAFNFSNCSGFAEQARNTFGDLKYQLDDPEAVVTEWNDVEFAIEIKARRYLITGPVGWWRSSIYFESDGENNYATADSRIQVRCLSDSSFEWRCFSEGDQFEWRAYPANMFVGPPPPRLCSWEQGPNARVFVAEILRKVKVAIDLHL